MIMMMYDVAMTVVVTASIAVEMNLSRSDSASILSEDNRLAPALITHSHQ